MWQAWGIADNLYRAFQWSGASHIHMVSQELQVLFTEDALCWVFDNFMLLKSCKDSAKVMPMLFQCRAGNEQVIQVGVAEG